MEKKIVWNIAIPLLGMKAVSKDAQEGLWGKVRIIVVALLLSLIRTPVFKDVQETDKKNACSIVIVLLAQRAVSKDVQGELWGKARIIVWAMSPLIIRIFALWVVRGMAQKLACNIVIVMLVQNPAT